MMASLWGADRRDDSLFVCYSFLIEFQTIHYVYFQDLKIVAIIFRGGFLSKNQFRLVLTFSFYSFLCVQAFFCTISAFTTVICNENKI